MIYSLQGKIRKLFLHYPLSGSKISAIGGLPTGAFAAGGELRNGDAILGEWDCKRFLHIILILFSIPHPGQEKTSIGAASRQEDAELGQFQKSIAAAENNGGLIYRRDRLGTEKDEARLRRKPAATSVAA